jgi:ferredoxin-type protein NapH
MSDPLVVAQRILAAKEIYVPLLLSVIIPVLFALALGPAFCGWMCPQGFISEIVESVRQKLKSRTNAGLAMQKGAAWIKVKWAILAVGMIAVGMFSLPLFNYISAPGIITAQVANAVFLRSAGTESLLIAAIVLLEILWLRRGWCKVVCPIGSALIALKTPVTLHLEHDKEHRCNTKACGVACVTSCQLDIDPRNAKELWLCTNCAACVDACPDDALQWKFLKGNSSRR